MPVVAPLLALRARRSPPARPVVVAAPDAPGGVPAARETSRVAPADSTRASFVLLLVDDDALMIEMLPRRLRRALRTDVEILTAATHEEAVGLMRSSPPDVVLSDYNLREQRTGLDVLGDAKTLAPRAVRILFSGHAPHEIAALGEAPIHAFLEKPMRLDELIDPLLDVIHRECGIDLRRGPAA